MSSEEFIVGEDALKKMGDEIAKMGEEGRTALGQLLLRTAIAVTNTAKKGIQTGSR